MDKNALLAELRKQMEDFDWAVVESPSEDFPLAVLGKGPAAVILLPVEDPRNGRNDLEKFKEWLEGTADVGAGVLIAQVFRSGLKREDKVGKELSESYGKLLSMSMPCLEYVSLVSRAAAERDVPDGEVPVAAGEGGDDWTTVVAALKREVEQRLSGGGSHTGGSFLERQAALEILGMKYLGSPSTSLDLLDSEEIKAWRARLRSRYKHTGGEK